MIATVLKEYGFNIIDCDVQSFGSGLINRTWTVIKANEKFILQRINQQIFKQPEYIAHNIRLVADYLYKNFQEYLFVAPVKTISGGDIVVISDEGYFRMFPFVKNSHTLDVVTNTQQAYEAARQFGAFTKKLSGLNVEKLKITLPDFHNLSLRYRQFEEALANGNQQRIEAAAEIVGSLKKHKNIVDQFEIIKADPDFKLRVMHHDTKISNVLFDANDKGLCVIDLDTIMPGYFISDVGDMLRTYLSPASEEEKDIDKVVVRLDYLNAIKEGYLSQMNDELTEKEKQQFIYAGKFMIYMQTLRFLTDHLNNDIYYGAKYEGHNLVRAKNQLTLLEKLEEKIF